MRAGSVLTFRLAGPLQSWSVTEGLSVSAAGKAPSKSGVVGLMAAALGRERGADLSDLADLGFLVRVDHPGQVMTDFHTVSRYLRPVPVRGRERDLDDLVDGFSSKTFSAESKHTLVKRQGYLVDAVFIAALVSRSSAEDDLLARVAQALAEPVFPLYLGRKACMAEPLGPELHQEVADPAELIASLPWSGAGGRRRRPEMLQLLGDEHLLPGATSRAEVADMPRGGRDFALRSEAAQTRPWMDGPPAVLGFSG